MATGYPQIDIESTMVHSWRRLLIGFLFLYVIGAAVFLLAGRGGPTVSSNPINSPSGASSHEGVYRLEFTTFDGDVTSFSSFAGLPLIVNFFASWCTPCVKEMPDFEKLHTSHGEQFTILGLAVEGRRPARELVESTGVTYSCLLYTSPSPRDLSTSRMPSSA